MLYLFHGKLVQKPYFFHSEPEMGKLLLPLRLYAGSIPHARNNA